MSKHATLNKNNSDELTRAEGHGGEDLDVLQLLEDNANLQAENESLRNALEAEHNGHKAVTETNLQLEKAHETLKAELATAWTKLEDLQKNYSNLKEQFALGLVAPPVDTGETYTIKDLNVLARKAKQTWDMTDFAEAINAHKVYLFDDKATDRTYAHTALQHLLKLSAEPRPKSAKSDKA